MKYVKHTYQLCGGRQDAHHSSPPLKAYKDCSEAVSWETFSIRSSAAALEVCSRTLWGAKWAIIPPTLQLPFQRLKNSLKTPKKNTCIWIFMTWKVHLQLTYPLSWLRNADCEDDVAKFHTAWFDCALHPQIDQRQNEGEPKLKKHAHNIAASVSFVCIIHVIPTNYSDFAWRQMSVYGGKWTDTALLHVSLRSKHVSSAISNSKDGLEFESFQQLLMWDFCVMSPFICGDSMSWCWILKGYFGHPRCILYPWYHLQWWAVKRIILGLGMEKPHGQWKQMACATDISLSFLAIRFQL